MGRPKHDDPRQMIGLRIPKSTVEKIDAWAADNGLSRTDALRTIMQAGLAAVGLTKPVPEASPREALPTLEEGRALRRARLTKGK